MTTTVLPHDPYITAVCEALAAAGLEPADCWTSDAESCGLYQYLSAVITLDPDTSSLPAKRWPNGLILCWAWHTGIEAENGEPDRGPSWEWAPLVDSHGRCGEIEAFTSLGYPSPAYVVESVRALIERRNQSVAAERWAQADELDAACEAWGAKETA